MKFYTEVNVNELDLYVIHGEISKTMMSEKSKLKKGMNRCYNLDILINNKRIFMCCV